MTLVQRLRFDDALERDTGFSERIRLHIESLDPGTITNAEAICAVVGRPHGHGDAVGAAIRAASKAGLLRATGRFLRATRSEARGRPIAEWRRTDA